MGNNLDRIVTVSIDIASPIIDSTSFDNLLIFGPAPKITAPVIPPAGTGEDAEVSAAAEQAAPLAEQPTPPAIGVYNSLEEVTSAGFVAVGDGADIVGVAARIAFSQSPKPSTIYIATLAEDGNLAETLDSLLGMDGWYVLCPVGFTEAQINTVIEWTEAQKKICGYAAYKPATAAQKIYYRSFGIFCKESYAQPDDEVSMANQCIAVAWATKCLFYHAGRETWAHKSLSGIAPSALNSTEIRKLEDGNISYFITTASKNITYNGKTLAGEWIDLIRFRDWLENDMQVRVANLFITNPKIPYTDKGIALVQNQMIASLKSGIYWGGIAPDEYDEDGNLVPAFVTHVPLSASLTAAQKASRRLTDCWFTARIAGAIHFVEIKGTLAYEL